MKELLIYNFDDQTDELLIRQLNLYLRTVDQCYMSRSWEGGPHLRVTFGKQVDEEKIQEIYQNMHLFMETIAIDREKAETISKKYRKHASVLGKLEGKQTSMNIQEHGTVKVVSNRFFFHNQEITNLFHELRFTIHDLLIDLYVYLKENQVQETHAFPILFYHVAETYKVDGMNKGYFSFISHVHGFFEESEKQNLPYSELTFEKEYLANKPFLKRFEADHQEYIQKWSKKWNELFISIKSRVDEVTDSAYDEMMKETFASLQLNYKNDFHQRFSKYALDEEFVSNQSATAYRFVINLLYMSLPLLRVSALRKQKYIYMAYRYTEQKYNIIWREQIGVI